MLLSNQEFQLKLKYNLLCYNCVQYLEGEIIRS